MRAPPFEQFNDVTNAAFLEKLARLRPKSIDEPIEILHPTLPIPQQPVVEAYQLCRDFMRIFDGFDDTHGIRLTVKKLLHTGNNRRRCGTMSTTGVRGDDQDFRNALRHWEGRFF